MTVPEKTQKPGINPLLALFLATTGVSFSSILIRLSTAPSPVTAALRLIFTLAVLAPFALAKNRAELKKITGRSALFSCCGGFFLGLHFWLWFESLKNTSVAIAATLCSTSAIFTAIGFAVILKGRIPKLGAAAIALTFGGAAVVALGARSGGRSQLLGALLAILSALFYAAYLLIGSIQRARLSATAYTLLTYTACMFTLLAACAFTRAPLLGWPGREYLVALALALVCTLMGHSVYTWCLRHLSPALVGTATLGEPVLAGIFAAILFREIPTLTQLAGAAAVLAGILLYARAERRAKTAPPVPAASQNPP